MKTKLLLSLVAASLLTSVSLCASNCGASVKTLTVYDTAGKPFANQSITVQSYDPDDLAQHMPIWVTPTDGKGQVEIPTSGKYQFFGVVDHFKVTSGELEAHKQSMSVPRVIVRVSKP